MTARLDELKMFTDYANHCFRCLRDRLIASASPGELSRLAGSAETMLGEINPGHVYVCEDLCAQLGVDMEDETGDQRVSGEAVQHDLRRFIEDITSAANLPADQAGETVHTIDDLAKMFEVSTKTISRWRTHGLVARRFLFEGRQRLGFLRSSVQRFVERNPRLVQRARKFRQLTTGQREAIIDQARQLSDQGVGLAETLRRLARQFNKSVETIRQTLRRHDREHPEQAVFPTSELNAAAKQRILQRYERGESVATLARRTHRSKQTIRRVIKQQRAARIAAWPLDFIPSPEFENTQLTDELLGPVPPADKPQRRVRPPKDLPAYLASLYDTPLLTAAQEHHQFRKYNYLKYRASWLRQQLDCQHPDTRLMDEIEQLIDQAERVKQHLVKANMRLVVSIAKRYVSPTRELSELVSDGNLSLMRAVEKFDFSRGFKFSTYATWAIIKNFARSLAVEGKKQARFKNSQEERLLSEVDPRSDEAVQLQRQAMREREVNLILRHLDDRERHIISARFGLSQPYQRGTLQEIGEELGVTKERVRQLEQRAMNKLRDAAREEDIRPDEAAF